MKITEVICQILRVGQIIAKTASSQLASQLCRPGQWEGRRVRALNPFSLEDATLLAAINRGEFTINGFRNRDLRPLPMERAR